jgi:PAS domain S-box-containing protein
MDIPSLGTDEVAVLAASFERMVRELRTTTVSRSFLDSIIASMGDSLIVTGPDGAIETVNQATCAMLGYDAPELVGASMRDVAPDADTALFGGSGSDGSPAEVRALETAYRSASGQIVPVSLSSSPIRRGAGTTQGVVCVAQDITERRNLERMKDEFIATLSHELRTPLTAVVSTLDMLAMGLLGEMSDKACELIEVGRRNGERLVALIDDVLDLSRIESGTLTDDVRRHELTEIVAEAVEANQAYAGQFGVTLTVAGGAHRAIVSVDRGRFIQVLSNLLSNAAKYSHRGGSVRVIVARHDGRARVSVVDEGAGIPADALDRVFDRFFRVDSSTTRERGGVGLGLSISKAIVERLGGDIGLNSQLGHGTTFWVDLPAHGDPDDSPEPRG